AGVGVRPDGVVVAHKAQARVDSFQHHLHRGLSVPVSAISPGPNRQLMSYYGIKSGSREEVHPFGKQRE
ncbi:MAG: hypothetical protein RDU41_10090, partial [Clostridia bacterium]|nr:hypothetical protein [Clostridia bacterium]